MMNQFLIENIYRERISSLKKENLAKFGKTKKNENFRRREFFPPRENGKKANLRGKEWGDHGIEWKFY